MILVYDFKGIISYSASIFNTNLKKYLIFFYKQGLFSPYSKRLAKKGCENRVKKGGVSFFL